MEQFVPRINEAFIDASGEIRGLAVPIWYDDYELDIGSFIAYEKDGSRFAMYLDRMDDDVFRRIYIREYDRNLLGRLPEQLYEDAEWIYEAHFLETQDDFQYGKYSIIDLDEEDLAKTMYVLMAGNDEFRKSSEQKFDVVKEEDLHQILDSIGLDVKVEETIKKTGRKTWTVYSEKGRRLGSAHSLPAAKRRLRQVEYFKHINEGRKWTEDEIRQIADENGVDLSQYDMNEIILGMPIELEHGRESQPDANLTDDDPFMTLQIVLAHLKEIKKYYSRMLIPAEEKAKSMQEAAEFGNQYMLVSSDGKGYFSADFTTKQPKFSTSAEDAYAYSEEEAAYLKKELKDQYNLDVEMVPYTHAVSFHEGRFELRVPMFEDFTNDEFRMSDWYIGNNGALYASDGRAVRDFDFEAPENQPTVDDSEKLAPYADVVKGAYRIFKNISAPHKTDKMVAFGFSGPKIKNGPYGGSDSWWTFGYDYRDNRFFLMNDASGQSYEISDPTDFRKVLSEIIHDLYESVSESIYDCPACGEPRVVTCKCAGFVKHDMDALRRGHGLMCANKHRWSRQTADGKVIILL